MIRRGLDVETRSGEHITKTESSVKTVARRFRRYQDMSNLGSLA